ncbi:Uncharacterised protein [Legionella pneumophila]|uniref:Uncharacterized protein n=3 Tax=Legionella TaxID=445 RepID=A0A378J823_9GAMM|nr:hypothetical protein lpa_01608 [Legionella pneumophila 2300/99 Alcoy]KTD06299.1 hypothetical protein Lgra_3076 [Legionella gratiana]CZG05384.1 Uncharacterised protein [Legionella pneumophila]SQG89910.1 Uncharacterised protein [Legionella pneumophila subsp. pascullei]CZG09454.1 Uncharacterised protein [Legionella pneumophila]
MGVNTLTIVLLLALMVLCLGLLAFLWKKKKNLRFVITILIFLILAAIFLHGVSFQLH